MHVHQFRMIQCLLVKIPNEQREIMIKFILILSIFFLNTTIQAQVINSDEQTYQNAGQYLVKPNGEYSVSYHDFFWVNGTLSNDEKYHCKNNPDPFHTKDNNEDFIPNNRTDFCREFVVRIYYPTNKNDDTGTYYKPMLQFFKDKVSQLPKDKYSNNVKQKLIQDLSTIQNFTLADKNIIKNQKFPVLFFSPGFSCNIPFYENFITHLVSHGYIVVGVNSLFASDYVALENGHIVHMALPQKDVPIVNVLLKTRSIVDNDLEFIYNKILSESRSKNADKVLNKIYSSMELTKIGIFGHSLGATAAADIVLAHPSWFKSAVTLELGDDLKSERPTRSGYPIPILHQEASLSRYGCTYSYLPKWQCEIDPGLFNLNQNGFEVIHQMDDSKKYMNYSDHMNFSDLSTLQYHPSINELVKNENAYDPALSNTYLGIANGWEVTNNINEYLLNFFNSTLKEENEHPFGDCKKPLTKNSKLICGPASGV